MNDIARNVKAARRNRGLSQEQAAIEIGCSTCSVQRWEQGKCCMSLQMAINLSRLYNVSLDELVYGKTVK